MHVLQQCLLVRWDQAGVEWRRQGAERCHKQVHVAAQSTVMLAQSHTRKMQGWIRDTPVPGRRLLDALVNLARLVTDHLGGASGDCLLADELGLHHVLLLHRPAEAGTEKSHTRPLCTWEVNTGSA